jgi:hypothetical protein
VLILYTIFFCGFGIGMVELPLTASASARIEEARKEAARKAYDKRNGRRGAPPGMERAKPMLRSESYGGLPRASAAPRPQQNSSLASALAETQGALQATIACLSKLGKELKLPAHCARCSSQTAPASAEPWAELLERMELCDRQYVDDDTAGRLLRAGPPKRRSGPRPRPPTRRYGPQRGLPKLTHGRGSTLKRARALENS